MFLHFSVSSLSLFNSSYILCASLTVLHITKILLLLYFLEINEESIVSSIIFKLCLILLSSINGFGCSKVIPVPPSCSLSKSVTIPGNVAVKIANLPPILAIYVNPIIR